MRLEYSMPVCYLSFTLFSDKRMSITSQYHSVNKPSVSHQCQHLRSMLCREDDFHDDNDSSYRSPTHSSGYRDDHDDFGSPKKNPTSPVRSNSYTSQENSSYTRKVRHMDRRQTIHAME